MTNTATESQFEDTTIERLQRLGYRYQYGGEIERPLHRVAKCYPCLRDSGLRL